MTTPNESVEYYVIPPAPEPRSIEDVINEEVNGVQFEDNPQELSLEDRVDYCARKLNEVNSKLDNLTNGVAATYQGVHNLVTMLSAVQQVASMMPGGKKIAKAMMDANSQNGTPSNG